MLISLMVGRLGSGECGQGDEAEKSAAVGLAAADAMEDGGVEGCGVMDGGRSFEPGGGVAHGGFTAYAVGEVELWECGGRVEGEARLPGAGFPPLVHFAAA